MYTYIYIYTHTHIYIYIYTCIYIYISLSIYIYICIKPYSLSISLYIYIHIRITYLYIYIHLRVYIYIHTYRHIYIYIYIYVYITTRPVLWRQLNWSKPPRSTASRRRRGACPYGPRGLPRQRRPALGQATLVKECSAHRHDVLLPLGGAEGRRLVAAAGAIDSDGAPSLGDDAMARGAQRSCGSLEISRP